MEDDVIPVREWFSENSLPTPEPPCQRLHGASRTSSRNLAWLWSGVVHSLHLLSSKYSAMSLPRQNSLNSEGEESEPLNSARSSRASPRPRWVNGGFSIGFDCPRLLCSSNISIFVFASGQSGGVVSSDDSSFVQERFLELLGTEALAFSSAWAGRNRLPMFNIIIINYYW